MTENKNVWAQVLARVRAEVDEEDFRRWFGATAYASDSGDQITVWVPTEAVRRRLTSYFREHLDRALEALDRADTQIRFVVTGFGDDEEDEKEDEGML